MNSRVFRKSKPLSAPKSSGKRASRDVLSGSSYTPSDDPPVINANPWSMITLTTDLKLVSNDYTYFKVSDLRNVLCAQTGFTGLDNKLGFEYRVQSLALWVIGQNQADSYIRMALFPMNLISSNEVELIRLDSNSVKNKFARVGYNYPLSHTTAVYSTNITPETVLFSTIATKASIAFLHYKILWRGANQGFKVTFPVTRYLKPKLPTSATTEQVPDDVSECLDFDTLSINNEEQLLDE